MDLPFEIILIILEQACDIDREEWRRNATRISWIASLAQISRTVEATIKPLLYYSLTITIHNIVRLQVLASSHNNPLHLVRRVFFLTSSIRNFDVESQSFNILFAALSNIRDFAGNMQLFTAISCTSRPKLSSVFITIPFDNNQHIEADRFLSAPSLHFVIFDIAPNIAPTRPSATEYLIIDTYFAAKYELPDIFNQVSSLLRDLPNLKRLLIRPRPEDRGGLAVFVEYIHGWSERVRDKRVWLDDSFVSLEQAYDEARILRLDELDFLDVSFGRSLWVSGRPLYLP